MNKYRFAMKKALEKTTSIIWHYNANGERIGGAPSGITGDLTNIRGDIDDCELTDDDRKRGVSVEELVEIKN